MSLAEFAAAAALLVVVPGAGTMLVIRNALRHGARGGIATAAGMVLGIVTWALLVAAGAALLLARFPGALDALRLAGACYIGWLGIRSIRQAWKNAPRFTGTAAPAGRPLRDGFVTNMLNPPLPLFYMAMLPQLLGPRDAALGTALVLAAIHGAEAFTWLSMVSLAIGQAQQLLMKDRVRRGIEAVAGVALLGLAVRLVLLAPR